MSEKSYSDKLAPPEPLYLGIDLGTSGCRAMAIDNDGKIHASVKTGYSKNGDSPTEWWQATVSVLKAVLKQVNHEHIQSIAVDGTSGSVLFCDSSGQPLSPCLMYNDQRAMQQAREISKYAPADSITLSATSGLAKILWLLDNFLPAEKIDPQQFHIVHQADWVAGMLAQRFNFSDANNALKTGYDIENHHWPLWLTDLLKQKFPKTYPVDKFLPEVYSPGEVVSSIDLTVASQLGLPFDTDIVSGTTDSTAAFIASDPGFPDNLEPGYAVTSLGSTLVMKVVSDVPVNRPESGIYSQPYGNSFWLVGGGSNSGGAVLRHYFSDEQIQKLTAQLTPDTSTGLDYYPLVQTGERFPVNDPGKKPVLGPRPETDVKFFQAMLEGMANIETRAYRLLEEYGAPYPKHVLSTGGGATNLAWEEIRADRLAVPVSKAKHVDAAYGTAKLAAKPYH